MPFLSLILLAAVFPAKVSRDEVPGLVRATEWVRGLDERALAGLVPEKTGLRFMDCPNCESGRQEGQLAWTPERPGEAYCRYCGHRYPSAKYPMDKTLRVRNPRGRIQEYPYWEDGQGYRHFFLARRDAEVRDYLATMAHSLARLYAATGERPYARRAALILDRFAEVFPGWCYRYDFPFRQKVFFEGVPPPEKFMPGFRTARWAHWCYDDVRIPLVEAFDWIRDSGVFEELSREKGAEVARRIERDLFRNAAEMVLLNPETYSNMSPRMWTSLILLGRVIGEPRYVEEARRRLREFVRRRFFYDGAWSEGAPSYWSMVLEGLDRVKSVLPGGAEFAELERSRAALEKMRLPDGRWVPVHDTWPQRAGEPTAESAPFLLPAVGHACLAGGQGGGQFQFHLAWSGGHGHDHAANLSLVAWAHGRELLSDLGYSHTRYRSWTLASAAHNTVVLDEEDQATRPKQDTAGGALRWFDAGAGWAQTVSVDGIRGYAGKAKTYRRTVIVVNRGRPYAVDIFEVEGGRQRDYILHGDAGAVSSVEAPLEFAGLGSLLARGFEWAAPRHEGETPTTRPHYAYGFFRGPREAGVRAGAAIPVVFRAEDGKGLRATVFPDREGRLVLAANPSIRLADEDDARLEKFQRACALLRHSGVDGPNRFAAVLEPWSGGLPASAVRQLAVPGAVFAVELSEGPRADVVVYGAPRRVEFSAAGRRVWFEGDVGVLAFNQGRVEGGYVLGRGGWRAGGWEVRSEGGRTAEVLAADADSFLLSAGPPGRAVLRVVTGDGWIYPYNVREVEKEAGGYRVKTLEATGLSYDAAAKRARLTTFPTRGHAGPLRAEWVVGAVSALKR